MRILGIDYGTKRIGIAIGDTDTKTAVPFAVVEESGIMNQELGVARIVKEEGISLIVAGLPTRTDGGKSEMQKKVEKFVRNLQARGLRVETQDERFTTKEVERAMRGYGKAAKGVDKDAAAAALILQSYLDGLQDSSQSSVHSSQH